MSGLSTLEIAGRRLMYQRIHENQGRWHPTMEGSRLGGVSRSWRVSRSVPRKVMWLKSTHKAATVGHRAVYCLRATHSSGFQVKVAVWSCGRWATSDVKEFTPPGKGRPIRLYCHTCLKGQLGATT